MSDAAEFAANHGAVVNRNGGMYLPGRAHSYLKKVEVAHAYQTAASLSPSGRPNLRAVAEQCQVDPSFVVKVEEELWVHGRILHPDEIRLSSDAPIGPGSLTLSSIDELVLLWLREKHPDRILKSYRDWLFYYTGAVVHESTIHRFFHGATPYKGGLVKPNLVPFDKFTVQNEINAREYLLMLMDLNPYKITFGDEKHLKGQELFSRKVRRDPLTGEVPVMWTDPDFRNTYSITGFCSINPNKPAPIWMDIHPECNDTERFIDSVCTALDQGFWDPYDILVLDNAKIHGEVIEKLLWQARRVLVIFLPTRSPEWNPKELVWALLVKRLSVYPIHVARERYNNSDVVALLARDILEDMTIEEVMRMYEHCYHFLFDL